MYLKKRLSVVPLALITIISGLSTGCTVHAGYYDPYYHDRHPWGGEVVYYQNWEHDTHREHREFKERNKREQKEYWDWRHKQH
jgi:hypothetical protein